jgi:glyoxylase-like metal-dependent hydrolase (beta-lactamase superfamily II)
MNRRSFIHSSALTIGALTLAQQKIFASMFDDPWKIKMLRNDIGVFTERGGTIGFMLSKKGIVVVDAQFPDQSKHLIDELKKRSTKSFKLLINTHHHGDHTAGNISFKGVVDHVLAHENSLKNQKNVAIANKTEDKQLYPDQTFIDGMHRKMGKEKISLYYYGPGHTDGDAIIHFEHANIVHMGDLMFNRRHPFVDRTAGASIKNWIDALHRSAEQFDNETIFIYGHAADGYEVTGGKDDLKAFGDYLGSVLNFVDGEIKAGKTKDEIAKTAAFPFKSEWKGDGIQRPITAAYDELTAK